MSSSLHDCERTKNAQKAAFSEQVLTGSFKRFLLGTMLLWSTSLKNSQTCSSCSATSLTAASTLPLDGAGEEWAESAGLGETLSNRFTLPVLELSASSSSSLDSTTANKQKHERLSAPWILYRPRLTDHFEDIVYIWLQCSQCTE